MAQTNLQAIAISMPLVIWPQFTRVTVHWTTNQQNNRTSTAWHCGHFVHYCLLVLLLLLLSFGFSSLFFQS